MENQFRIMFISTVYLYYRKFKLNWSTYGTTKTSQVNSLKPSVEIQVYVADFPLNITEYKLLEIFKLKYISAFMCKIITDPLSKHSKGYGFIKFSNQEDANKAILDMNGFIIQNKPIKVS